MIGVSEIEEIIKDIVPTKDNAYEDYWIGSEKLTGRNAPLGVDVNIYKDEEEDDLWHIAVYKLMRDEESEYLVSDTSNVIIRYSKRLKDGVFVIEEEDDVEDVTILKINWKTKTVTVLEEN
jgi:hypothetical protein